MTYVNSSAEVKAESDVCVTSANAVAVVRALGAEKILFAPDRNLGSWVARSLPEVDVVLWEGWCPTHDDVTVEMVQAAQAEHPAALVMAHPECRPEVVDLADAVLSTSQMLSFAAENPAERVHRGHRGGAASRAGKAAPGKRFFELAPRMLCPNMKVTTLVKVRDCLPTRPAKSWSTRRFASARCSPSSGWSPLADALARRYLLEFDTDQCVVRECDVLVVGSGIAGLTAALAASKTNNVALVTKGRLTETNTWYAQGGIAGAVGEADSVELHLADTLVVGQGLCDEAVVRAVVGEAPEALAELREYGVRFDLAEGGEVALAREGGHSLPRVLHSGDATGAAIQHALTDALRASERVAVFEQRFLVDLLTDDGCCVGALVLDTATGEREVFWAESVVLATGGAGQVYRVTTNPAIATGDGLAAAWRAGAACRGPRVRAVPPHGARPRGRAALPDHRGAAWRRRLPARLLGGALHARRSPAGRARSARRGQPGDRSGHGALRAQQRLPRCTPSRRGVPANALPDHLGGVRRGRLRPLARPAAGRPGRALPGRRRAWSTSTAAPACPAYTPRAR